MTALQPGFGNSGQDQSRQREREREQRTRTHALTHTRTHTHVGEKSTCLKMRSEVNMTQAKTFSPRERSHGWGKSVEAKGGGGTRAGMS